jgi:hypothetical protein
MIIDNYEKFSGLPNIPLENLQPSDLLIKKVFPGSENGLIEKVITRMQRRYEKDEIVSFNGEDGWQEADVSFLGSATSEHAALVINNGNMAEAIGGGVVAATLQSRAHEKYIVYRCLEQRAGFNQEVVRIATAIAAGRTLYQPLSLVIPIPIPIMGGYSLDGAILSSFRSRYYQQGQTEELLRHIIYFSEGRFGWAPNMFCSEFVIICYEVASLNLYGKTLFGTNPRGMSPMEMENIINSRPDKMMLVGRIENPIDIVFKAVKDGIEEYKKTLRGGVFRRPSRESVDAFFILRGFLDVGPTVAIIFVAAHYARMETNLPYVRPAQIAQLTNPLKQNSTFFRILQTNLRRTRFFL